MPIYWATKNFFAFQILQSVSIVREYLKDLERPKPEGIELTMLAPVLPGRIPFEHQITLLEFFLSALPVESLLDLLLTMVGRVHDLLPNLLYFHHLINPSNHMVRLSFKVLEEIHHR